MGNAAWGAVVAVVLFGCSSTSSGGGKQGSANGKDGGSGGASSACSTNTDCRLSEQCVDGTCAPIGSGNTGGGASTGGATSGTGATNSGGVTGSGAANGGGGAQTSGGATGSGGASGCQGAQPLDVFVLLNQSGSMNERVGSITKWQTFSDGMKGYLNDSSSAGVDVGVGYFPLGAGAAQPGTCQSVADCGPGAIECLFGTCIGASNAGLCDATDFENPDVPFALPPNHAAGVTSVVKHTTPGAGGSIRPALEGSLNYASAWAKSHPGRKVIVVLATDGGPTGCTTNTIADVETVAANGLTTLGIPTYVIGIGTAVTDFNGVAAAGGTSPPTVIAAADAGPNSEFEAAMKAIQADATGCAP